MACIYNYRRCAGQVVATSILYINRQASQRECCVHGKALIKNYLFPLVPMLLSSDSLLAEWFFFCFFYLVRELVSREFLSMFRSLGLSPFFSQPFCFHLGTDDCMGTDTPSLLARCFTIWLPVSVITIIIIWAGVFGEGLTWDWCRQ